MGEVYRADDLKLGQAVALKFLPDALSANEGLLDRFYGEVRIARQVSHPGVCRVYDVGEVEGIHFISMEYIDGEDLGSLLRRIGRLPGDKAVEISRQICAGLAAAHEKGVLHRDLKPANVMIDGRGHARIADFGLAGVADEIRGREIGSGTPAYMAPDQLSGREVTVRSDIYSLGLVLYELFTGRRALEAESLEQLRSLHETGAVSSPSSHVQDLDPAVERVILRCLEKDPSARPPSALAVAAALPGGDPLAAALAAGETPSPEMVAAAGDEGAIGPALAWSGFGAFAVMMVGVALLAGSTSFFALARVEKPPQALADRARSLLETLGYADPPADSAWGYATRRDVVRWLGEHEPDREWRERLSRKRPAGVMFWYRESPRRIAPLNGLGDVSWQDPPETVSGMATVFMDTQGRLLELRVVPPQVEPEEEEPEGRATTQSGAASTADAGEEEAPRDDGPSSEETEEDTAPRTGRASTAEAREAPAPRADGAPSESVEGAVPFLGPDWSALLAAGEIDPSRFTRARSTWTPLSWADSRAAWTGEHDKLPSVPIRVEAASYRGRPVWFRTIGPWSHPERMQASQPGLGPIIGQGLFVTFTLTALGVAVVMARRNLRMGRGDRRGAFRIALYLFVTSTAGNLLGADHVAEIQSEWTLLILTCGLGLFIAGFVWLLYIALEPLIRRHWPEGIISWTRLLAGRFRDPLVGRDVLAGCVAGASLVLLDRLYRILPGPMGMKTPPPNYESAYALTGPLPALNEMLGNHISALVFSMLLMFFFFLGSIRGKSLIGAGVFMAIYTTMETLFSGADPLMPSLALGIASAAVVTTVYYRYGLLAATAAIFIDRYDVPLTLDFAAWYAAHTFFPFVLVFLLAAWAAWTAQGRRPALPVQARQAPTA